MVGRPPLAEAGPPYLLALDVSSTACGYASFDQAGRLGPFGVWPGGRSSKSSDRIDRIVFLLSSEGQCPGFQFG